MGMKEAFEASAARASYGNDVEGTWSLTGDTEVHLIQTESSLRVRAQAASSVAIVFCGVKRYISL